MLVTGVQDNQQPDDLEAGEGVYLTMRCSMSRCPCSVSSSVGPSTSPLSLPSEVIYFMHKD